MTQEQMDALQSWQTWYAAHPPPSSAMESVPGQAEAFMNAWMAWWESRPPGVLGKPMENLDPWMPPDNRIGPEDPRSLNPPNTGSPPPGPIGGPFPSPTPPSPGSFNPQTPQPTRENPFPSPPPELANWMNQGAAMNQPADGAPGTVMSMIAQSGAPSYLAREIKGAAERPHELSEEAKQLLTQLSQQMQIPVRQLLGMLRRETQQGRAYA